MGDDSTSIPDNRNIAGNLYDKYRSRNPAIRMLMRGFFRAFDELTARTEARSAFEVGCGEGYLTLHLLRHGIDARGCDVDEQIVEKANRASTAQGFGDQFTVASIYDLPFDAPPARLIVCCEVLEHLPLPDEAARRLALLADPYMLVSAPREPIWSVLNVLRGKYWSRMGNTPGHLQRWTSRGFTALLSRHAEILAVRQPLPWTMILCKTPRDSRFH